LWFIFLYHNKLIIFIGFREKIFKAIKSKVSTYFLSLPVNKKEKVTAEEKQHLLKYQPVTLELVKKDHNWRVVKMDSFLDYLQQKATFFSKAYNEKKLKGDPVNSF